MNSSRIKERRLSRLAESIARNAQLALATSKRLVKESAEWESEDLFKNQDPIVRPGFASEGAVGGAKRFAGKREPVWKSM